MNGTRATNDCATIGQSADRRQGALRRSGHGHRDATLILIAFRHGLRASEIAGLEWSQVEFSRNAALHVRRVKNGTLSVHPLQGDELRALRELSASNVGMVKFFSFTQVWKTPEIALRVLTSGGEPTPDWSLRGRTTQDERRFSDGALVQGGDGHCPVKAGEISGNIAVT